MKSTFVLAQHQIWLGQSHCCRGLHVVAFHTFKECRLQFFSYTRCSVGRCMNFTSLIESFGRNNCIKRIGFYGRSGCARDRCYCCGCADEVASTGKLTIPNICSERFLYDRAQAVNHLKRGLVVWNLESIVSLLVIDGFQWLYELATMLDSVFVVHVGYQ